MNAYRQNESPSLQLEVRLAELIREKVRIERALALLKDTPEQVVPVVKKSRAELLHQYLLHQMDGVRITEVPKLLAELGHQSRSPNPQTNWLYQDRCARRWFEVKGGLVTLRPQLRASPNSNLAPASAAPQNAQINESLGPASHPA